MREMKEKERTKRRFKSVKGRFLVHACLKDRQRLDWKEIFGMIDQHQIWVQPFQESEDQKTIEKKREDLKKIALLPLSHSVLVLRFFGGF